MHNHARDCQTLVSGTSCIRSAYFVSQRAIIGRAEGLLRVENRRPIVKTANSFIKATVPATAIRLAISSDILAAVLLDTDPAGSTRSQRMPASRAVQPSRWLDPAIAPEGRSSGVRRAAADAGRMGLLVGVIGRSNHGADRSVSET